jgi:hypothetical protein
MRFEAKVELRKMRMRWGKRKEKEEGTEKLKILEREREGIIPILQTLLANPATLD